MSEGGGNIDFDMQAAWLRRFKSDAESNLKAFALRLKEAMPELVTVHESRGLFRAAKVTGVTVELGDSRYLLEIVQGTRTHDDVALGGSPRASIALLRKYSKACPWKSRPPLLVTTRTWPPEDRPYSAL